ncbi:MAG: hypothetical protein ACRELY_32055 [Polyangiaceae bacterium]
MNDTAITLVFAGIGAIGVARMQPGLAGAVHEVKARDDVYALPPPRELRAMTLGYHAAAVDQLWAKLLVEYGIHWVERREFSDLDNYIEAIFALEKDYAPLYHYVSTLLVYRPTRGYEVDARKARAYLEQGTRERPDDLHVWLDYGEFIAYLGPSWLPTDAERDQWRHDGAMAIAHAVELGAAPDRSIDVASTLHRFGERDAAIRELRRGYALTDDPQKRAEILARLQSLVAAGEREEVEDDLKVIEGQWRTSYPFLSRGEYLMLGPNVDAMKCAGTTAATSPKECARDWPTRLAK